MRWPVSVVVKHDGKPLPLRFDACRIALGGEFAGNVDLEVGCEADAVEAVVEQLSVQLPGGVPSGPALGSRTKEAGIELGFWSEEAQRLQAPPEHVDLLWARAPIARVAPTPHESLPIDPTLFKEPGEIGTAHPLVTSATRVRLAANRERWWYLLVAATVVVGVLGGTAWSTVELPALVWTLGGAFVAVGAALGLFLARTPYRQVWLDRDRRRVLTVEGRSRRPEARLADASGRSLDEFDHVRLFMRWQRANGIDEGDQEAWFVTLEGPITHAGSDGRIHLRPDALAIGEMRSERQARELAARVAFHTGLKILETGHDGSA